MADLTGFPEMMDGGSRHSTPRFMAACSQCAIMTSMLRRWRRTIIDAIDLLVVNLYPFEQTVMSGAYRDTHYREYRHWRPRHGSIGGEEPCLRRDPDRPCRLCRFARRAGRYRRHQSCASQAPCRKAYARTAAYDSMIASWFAFVDQGRAYPESRFIVGTKAQDLRYGENPHQNAALYLPMGPATPGVAQAEQVQGKELSYNNLNDANAAIELVAEFRDGPPTVVIVKHANPCGVASADSLVEAWQGALQCDSVSAFGGSSRSIERLTLPTAEAHQRNFHRSRVAPNASDDAKAIFARKKNLRLLLTGQLPDPARGGQTVAVIAGGPAACRIGTMVV